MEKLSYSKYVWRCVVGGELAFLACMGYGLFLSGKSAELHRALFELFHGFVWGELSGIFFGALSVASWSAAGGAYIVWMHNASLVSGRK